MSLAEQRAALDVRYPALASQVPTIRHAVGEIARGLGADDDVLLQIKLAVSEAATNAILHAYRDRAAGDAGDVRVVVHGGELDDSFVVHVYDRGVGLTPRPDSPGLGLGLCLMAHETDRFEICKAPDGGTEVVLHFRLSGLCAAL
ncbi:MAG: serine/threonine-protein kinase RsbW [Solirubrobacteraceae bacterium]|jgi:anti-sigma regulatory factor (Ser/Thr protein kinase)|nr:serine/threonine-protein kinase RsbW [Solirubrobacteraceae bacterium]